MAFTVASRTKEIGIRVSLGAQQSNVLGMMMREVAIVMLPGNRNCQPTSVRTNPLAGP